jgi:hypothetical protein
MANYTGRYRAPEWGTAVVGDRVSTPGGVRLGTVGAVADSAFRVDGGSTYWLSAKAIFTRVEGELTVVCEPAGLTRVTLPEPDR